MADTIEKIYCSDRGDDNALTAAILSNNRRDDGYNNWMNNPFAYLMFLAFTHNGFGNDNNNAALEAIRTQMQDNQNSSLIMSALGDGFNRNDFALSQLAQNLNVDFNTLQKCCCDVQAAIREVGGAVNFSAEKVINAANLGDCRIIEALNNCCCSTQRQIADFRADLLLQNCKDTAELRNGTTVFVPVTARVTVVTQGCGCNAKTQLFTEQFYVAFQGQTAVPTAVTITSVGRVQGGACVQCGCAHAYSINDSLVITITPPAA